MPSAGSAYVLIKGDFGPLRAGLRQAEHTYGRQVDSMGTRLSRGFKTAAKLAGVGLAAGAAAGAKKAFSEFEESEKVARQTEAALRSTGGAARVNAKDIAALADAISRKSAVDDEAIQSAENLLLTFTKVRNEAGEGNDIFTQATAVIADMSAALGQDFKSSTIQIGKALQDPIKGITALRRVGVNFNAQQTEQVKKMVESGRQLDAQKFILRELNREFAGSARAQATSSDRIKVAFDNLFESIGRSFAPAVEKALDGLSKFADDVSAILDRKDLTASQKFDRIGDEIAQRLEAALPVIAEAAGRIGPRVALAFVKGFLQAPALVQIVTGAWLFSKSSKILAAFGLLGTQAGGSFGAGFAGGAAGGGAAGGAGGAAAGGLAGLATRLKGTVTRAGFTAVGVAAALEILKGAEREVDKGSDDLNERLKALGEGNFIDQIKRNLGKAVGVDFGPLFDSKDEETARRLRGVLKGITEDGRGISQQTAQAATGWAKQLDLTRQQRQEIRRILDLGRQNALKPTVDLTNLADEIRKAGRLTPKLINDISAQLNELPRATRPKFAQAVLDWAAELKKTGRLKGSIRQLKEVIGAEVDGVGNLSLRGPSRLRRRLQAGFEAMVTAVARPSTQMASVVRTYLEAFGAAGISKLDAAINSAKDPLGGRKPKEVGSLATGGFLGGKGLRDTIPIIAAPGEAVLNRHQQMPVESALRQTYGYGLGELFRKERRPHYMAKGGFVNPDRFAKTKGLVTGDTDFLPALFNALQKMARAARRSIYVQSGRRTIAEQQSLFNQLSGTRPVARPSPNAPHVRGIAADITPGREVFGRLAGKYGLGFTVPSESWHIQLLDAGKVEGGARGTGTQIVDAPDLGRIRIRGKGVTRELAQAAADKVSRAAQRFVDRAAGTGIKGGGNASANRRLGRRMSKAVFGDDQWGALSELWQRESGWSTTSDNPTSDAYGIPQALPGSKMSSAGRDWRTNPATQIKWGLSYIKGRYGTPSAALAFHDAHNWYKRGGFIDGDELKAHDAKRKPPKGLKKPSGRKHEARPKPKKTKAQKTTGFQLKQLDFLNVALDKTIPAIQDRISSLSDTFGLSDEEYYPDERVIPRLRSEGHDLQKLGESFIDWTAVGQRKNELTSLLGESFRLIGEPFGKPQGVMDYVKGALDPLMTAVRGLVQRLEDEIKALRDRVRDNTRKIKSLDRKIRNERDKKHPNRKRIDDWAEERNKLADENRRLTGERTPESLADITKGTLGDRNARLEDARKALEDLVADKDEFVGPSGIGGTFHSQLIQAQEWAKEFNDLSADRIKEAVAPTQEDKAQEVRAFFVSIADLFKSFGPNFKPLPSFEGGGVIQGPKGSPITIQGHGGEVVFDPNTKSLVIKVAQDTNGPQQKVVNIDARQTFAQVPANPHLYSRNVKHELEAALS